MPRPTSQNRDVGHPLCFESDLFSWSGRTQRVPHVSRLRHGNREAGFLMMRAGGLAVPRPASQNRDVGHPLCFESELFSWSGRTQRVPHVSRLRHGNREAGFLMMRAGGLAVPRPASQNRDVGHPLCFESDLFSWSGRTQRVPHVSRLRHGNREAGFLMMRAGGLAVPRPASQNRDVGHPLCFESDLFSWSGRTQRVPHVSRLRHGNREAGFLMMRAGGLAVPRPASQNRDVGHPLCFESDLFSWSGRTQRVPHVSRLRHGNRGSQSRAGTILHHPRNPRQGSSVPAFPQIRSCPAPPLRLSSPDARGIK